MRILSIFLLLISLTSLQAQNNPEFTKEHRQIEAQRKALTYEKAIIQGTLFKADPGRGYDVNYYRLSLDIYPSQANMWGILNINATVSDESLADIWLDFQHNLTVDSIAGEAVEGLLGYSHSNGRLSITLDRTYNADEMFSLTVYYHGRTDFGGQSVFGLSFGHTEIYGREHIWSLSEPYGARDWWPCKDTPLDKADSMDIYYTVPQGMTAIANGKLISEVSNNNRSTFHWKVTYPIATYLVSIAAYAYQNYYDEYISQSGDSLAIMFFVAPENYTGSLDNFAKVKPMIAAFADVFGEYPFMGEKYGHAEAAISGGMEHQTITTLGSMQETGGYYSEGLIVHELAHQWWGDMVTCASFSDIWLNEGFATYSEELWAEYMYGPETYKSLIADEAYFGGGTIYVADTTNAGKIFNSNLSYSKAAYVLHMLRGVVGDETFFDIMKAWYDNGGTKYNSAYTEDFQQVCEQVSGLNLDKFFQQWIYGEYFPVYSYGYKTTEVASGYEVTLFIDQKQDNTGLFWMPVDVRIYTNTDTVDTVAWDSLASQKFTFNIENEPVDVEIDPDDWILKQTRRGLFEPDLNQGILLVNGLNLMLPDVYEAYESKAFWGSAPITFWDILAEPSSGYPETLPEPAGNGEITKQTIAQYSTIIWLSSNTIADRVNWNNLPVIDYLQAGGNILLISPSGIDFLDDDLIDYLGISWDPQGELLIQGNISSNYQGLWDIALNNNMSNITCFDTALTNVNSSLLYTAAIEGFEAAKGVGVWSNPDTTGDFVYLAARPWMLNHKQLRTNMLYMLENFMNEPIVSINDNEGENLPLTFEINKIYPNPFNPSTRIEFSMPAQGKVTLKIYNILGKQVAELLRGTLFTSGSHSVQWNAANLATGIYFIRLQASGRSVTKKAVLMK